jgi:hypothetical protein
MTNFFNHVRAKFGRLRQSQVNGIEAILAATSGLPTSWRAYILATAWHETAGTMQPIREYGMGRGKRYGRPGRNGGQIPYGRGYVQLTWDDNYETLDKALKLNGALIKNYDLALEPNTAASILVHGMTTGLFDGKRRGLKDFIPCDRGTKEQFIAARRTVNIQDKADMIADYAVEFQIGLTK